MTSLRSGIKLKPEWDRAGLVNVELSTMDKEGTGRFEVYHAKQPTFRVSDTTYNLDDFEVVLRMKINLTAPVGRILEMAFRITNSVEQYWVDWVELQKKEWEEYQAGGEIEGILVVPSETEPKVEYHVVGKDHRSTSVGDIINDLESGKWFMVAPMGYVELKEVLE